MINENHPTNASISTMWAINNYPDLNAFFLDSKKLGFQKIELNHQVDSSMLARVNLDHYQFSSIHEPCPADISNKDLVDRDWLISSDNEDYRTQGVKAVKKSIKLANELHAPTVCVHCGNVCTDMSYEIKLRSIYKAGQSHSDEYQEIKSGFMEFRKSIAGPRLDAVKKSLVELIEYATSLDVKLGLENRYHYTDMPTIDEMEELLDLGQDSRLGFIYDVGHAQALDRLGFFAHKEWLNRFSSRIFGSHLHDVIGLADHLAPGLGEIDFYHIANFLPEDSFRTMELQSGNTIAQVRAGVNLLLQAGCIKYI